MSFQSLQQSGQVPRAFPNRHWVWCLASALLLCSVAGRADEITVKDQRGKTITLSHPAERVVVIPKPIASTVIAIDGGTQHLVGINPASQAVMMKSALGAAFPDIARIDTNVVREGFRPNVEELLKLHPDIVIQWARDADELIEPMERVGLNVVAFGSGTNEIERDRITIIGTILNQQARAKSFLDLQDDVLQDIKSHLANIPQDRRARVVLFDRFRSDGRMVFGQNEFFFQATGVRNCAFEAGMNQRNVAVNAEQLLAWDPDIVFLNYYDDPATPQDVYDDPVLANLSAVKNRRVYKTPRLDPASHEAPLVWMWMAMLAYPQLFDWDVRKSIEASYLKWYGKAVSKEELDNIVQMPANSSGKYYDKLVNR